jgi:hypothetical protein
LEQFYLPLRTFLLALGVQNVSAQYLRIAIAEYAPRISGIPQVFNWRALAFSRLLH